MGILFSVACRNKECKWHKVLREGPGMSSFADTCRLERSILSGEKEAPEDIKELLNKGYHLDCVKTFLCPKCKEWVNNRDPYIYEPIHVSPYGTVREYKMHYVYGHPKCDVCGTELVHILKPRSSKNKCPKCGQDNMRAKNIGYYD